MNHEEKMRWFVVSQVLAFEVLLPMWPAMGLDFVAPGPLRRRALELLREDRAMEFTELREQLGEAAVSPTGEKVKDRFDKWVSLTWVTRPQHHPSWFGLRRAAHRACSRPDRYRLLNLPGAESRDFKRRHDATMDMTDVEHQLASLRKRELGDLDVEVCLRAGFDPHVASLDFFTPVLPVCRMQRFQAMMVGVVADYPAEALDALRKGLVVLAKSLELTMDPPPMAELVSELPLAVYA